ncbi:ribosomal RNA small subunit methyltransferase A [Actinomycetes bacterium]|nr:ribosomal RNA small subunit methyltransferase A [Actinomycetes bacterium]
MENTEPISSTSLTSPTLGATEIREIAKLLDLHPAKSLGQNFVIDGNTCRKIVRLADINNKDIVLEIGPGLGSLTIALLPVAREVIAVEIDRRLATQLIETMQSKIPNHADKLQIINEDAQLINTLPQSPTALVANLPYNISVPVILHFLEKFPSINKGLVMVQAEVAQRLAAKPGNKIYGTPSVKAKWWADMSIAGTVSREVFWPIPNVDSLLVAFKRGESPGDEALRVQTFTVIEAAFSQRRKMLRSALSVWAGGSSSAIEILEKAGVAQTSRAEELVLKEFIAIAQARSI